MRKIFVATRSLPMGLEYYIGVAGSYKKAEELLKLWYPNMRRNNRNKHENAYWANVGGRRLRNLSLYIREVEI